MSNKKNAKYSFEEYKLYYESTERVTNRRLSTNKFNYSISTTLILVITYVWNWSNKNSQFSYVAFTITLAISFMAALFCSLWIGTLKDYKLLNTAKFEILNEMSQNLTFGTEKPKVISSNPFQKEWEKLNKMNALEDVNLLNILALKSSNIEFYIPKAFRIIFIIIFLISFVSIITHIDSFIMDWKNLIKL